MKTHRTDPVSLAFGLIFLGVAGAWLISDLADVGLPEPGWFIAGGLVLFGLLGLLGALRPRGGPRPAQVAPAPAPDTGPDAGPDAPVADTGADPPDADVRPTDHPHTTVEISHGDHRDR